MSRVDPFVLLQASDSSVDPTIQSSWCILHPVANNAHEDGLRLKRCLTWRSSRRMHVHPGIVLRQKF